jgi:tol-pal system protein YbgF
MSDSNAVTGLSSSVLSQGTTRMWHKPHIQCRPQCRTMPVTLFMKPLIVWSIVFGAVFGFETIQPRSGSILDYAYAEERASPTSDVAAKRLYTRVMEEFDKGHYEPALAGFQFFVALYPQSSLASSAQFWAGECEYRLGRYKNAIDSLSRVITKYRNSPKKAGATLKMGMAYSHLGQQDVSMILLERVLVEFPNTPEAQLAGKTIEQLRQSHETNEVLSQSEQSQFQRASR